MADHPPGRPNATGPDRPFTRQELIAFLAQGDDHVRTIIAKLDRYIADPDLKSHREALKGKRDQLEKLLAVELGA